MDMDRTVRCRLRRRKTRCERIATPHVMIGGRARTAPSALLRRGRRGAQLLARGRPAAHGRVAGEPGDPAAGDRARRRAVRAHDAPRRAHRRRPPAARRRRGARCRPSRPRSRTRCARATACSGTLRLGSSPAARHEIRPALLAQLRDRYPGIAVDASEATTGNLCRELLSHRLDVALGFCTEPVPGLARRTLLRERMHVFMRRTHRHAGAGELELEALRGDRFVVPAEDLNSGFNRRLRLLCREHGFEPRDARRARRLGGRGVAARRRSGHAGHGADRAPRRAAHGHGAARARAVSAARARLARGRRLARPAQLPRGRYAAPAGSRIVNAGSSSCSSGPIESA